MPTYPPEVTCVVMSGFCSVCEKWHVCHLAFTLLICVLFTRWVIINE